MNWEKKMFAKHTFNKGFVSEDKELKEKKVYLQKRSEIEKQMSLDSVLVSTVGCPEIQLDLGLSYNLVTCVCVCVCMCAHAHTQLCLTEAT